MRSTQLRGGLTMRWPQLLGAGLLGVAVFVSSALVSLPALASKPHKPQPTHGPHPAVARGAAPAHSASVARHVSAVHHAAGRAAATPAHGKRGPQTAKNAKMRVARGGGLQCVPFARSASGIEVSGNAHMWWDNAAGIYERGQVPERGSVLSFRANRSMPLGHVAVVSRVVNAREVEIDHANWGGPGGRKGSISRGASVIDVSDNNDWTAVRVELGQSGEFGSIYPTNGFIYDRPATGRTVVAARGTPAPIPELNAAPRDLRPAGGSTSGYASVSFVGGGPYEEVADATPAARHTPVLRHRKPVHPRH